MSGFLVSSGVYVDGGDAQPPRRAPVSTRTDAPDTTAAWVIPTGLPATALAFAQQDPPGPRQRARPAAAALDPWTPPQPGLYVTDYQMALWQPQDGRPYRLPIAAYRTDAPPLQIIADASLLGCPWQGQDAGGPRLLSRRPDGVQPVLADTSVLDLDTAVASWTSNAGPRGPLPRAAAAAPEAQRPLQDSELVTLAFAASGVSPVRHLPRRVPTAPADAPLAVWLDLSIWVQASAPQAPGPRGRYPQRPLQAQTEDVEETYLVAPADQFVAALGAQPPRPGRYPGRVPLVQHDVIAQTYLVAPADQFIAAAGAMPHNGMPQSAGVNLARFPARAGTPTGDAGPLLAIALAADQLYRGWDAQTAPPVRLLRHAAVGDAALTICDASLLSTIDLAFVQDPGPPRLPWLPSATRQAPASETAPWLATSIIVIPGPYRVIATDVWCGGAMVAEVFPEHA